MLVNQMKKSTLEESNLLYRVLLDSKQVQTSGVLERLTITYLPIVCLSAEYRDTIRTFGEINRNRLFPLQVCDTQH